MGNQIIAGYDSVIAGYMAINKIIDAAIYETFAYCIAEYSKTEFLAIIGTDVHLNPLLVLTLICIIILLIRYTRSGKR